MLPSLSKRELDIIGDVADEFVKRSSADSAVSEGISPFLKKNCLIELRNLSPRLIRGKSGKQTNLKQNLMLS